MRNIKSHIGAHIGMVMLSLATSMAVITSATASPFIADTLPAPNEFASRDVLIASFMVGKKDQTDVVYGSMDGMNFTALSVAYENANKDSEMDTRSTQGDVHHVLGDPSIIYHAGKFWMLSAWQRHDGKLWPMIGVSEDGKEWAYPEGQFNDGHWGGIELDTPAPGCDTVAPEWFQDSNGDLYILFSAGHYGAFHGDPQNDNMRPYIARVHLLVNTGYDTYDSTMPKIKLITGKAKQIPLGNEDRIDGSIFHEGRNYYMAIKRDGVSNEIWQSTNVSDPQSWTRIANNIAVGYEGPSLTKLNGKYLLYADKLGDYPYGSANGQTGTFLFTSDNPAGPWSSGVPINTMYEDGTPLSNRHGSVRLATNPAEKAKMYAMWVGA